MVDELDVARYEIDGGTQIGPVVAAPQPPPFLTERRIVLARHAGVFSTADSVAPLLAYLADPLPTTALVLVWERSPKPGPRLGPSPPSLPAPASKRGAGADAGPGPGKARARGSAGRRGAPG